MGQSTPGISALRKAIESRDTAGMKAPYAPDAVLTIIDQANQPSHPRVIRGATEVGSNIEDVCARGMTHTLEHGVVDGNRLAFVERCAYPDGVRVVASCTAETGRGGIIRQTTMQAWDS